MIKIEHCKVENLCRLEHDDDGIAALTYVPSPPPLGGYWHQVDHLSDWHTTMWRRITLVETSS